MENTHDKRRTSVHIGWASFYRKCSTKDVHACSILSSRYMPGLFPSNPVVQD